MWCYNFDRPETFINYICVAVGRDYLKQHLMEKWTYIYEKYGFRSVMTYFYTELDPELKKALVDYVMLVYAPHGMKSAHDKLFNL